MIHFHTYAVGSKKKCIKILKTSFQSAVTLPISLCKSGIKARMIFIIRYAMTIHFIFIFFPYSSVLSRILPSSPEIINYCSATSPPWSPSPSKERGRELKKRGFASLRLFVVVGWLPLKGGGWG
jgi:hypothetical protein